MKKQEIQVAATSNDIASDTSTGKTQNKDTAKEKAELCIDGNCPCGDGFCAKNSVCIKDTCFCGAFPEKGYIDKGAVASNHYGEFECVRYYFQEGCNEEYHYDYICKRSEGCKTGDGRQYPFSDINADGHDLDGWDYINEEMSELHLASKSVGDEFVDLYDVSNLDEDIASREKYLPYENVIREPYIQKCGAKLPENLKYMVRSDLSVLPSALKYVDLDDTGYEIDPSPSYCENYWSKVVTPREPECNLRKACNDIGVTPDHIVEYVCEIGKKPTGLRCIQSEGCTCGDTRCSQHALCKDGSCMYDIYYKHRTCPENGWNPARSDIYNFALTSDALKCVCDDDTYDEQCFDNCIAHNMDFDEEDCKQACHDEGDCYEKCYWDYYDDTMTKIDPCK
ncbi:MAG: hypothetical protein IJM59_13000 [Proteobacteria bacterium]|nr:hypothetical protein [Pseudomonadota bacterium]